jgi:hypothetical protein
LERTATIGLNATKTISVDTASKTRAVMVRSPACPLWIDEKPASATEVSLMTQPVVVVDFSAIGSSWILPQGITFTKTLSGGGDTSIFDRWPSGVYNGDTYHYVPEGAQYRSFIEFSAGINAVMILTYSVWTPSDQSSFTSSISLAGPNGYSAATTLASAAWVCLKSVRQSGTAGIGANLTRVGLVVNLAATDRYLLPAFVPPELQNSTLPYTNSRQTASSALFTNVSTVMSKEGTVQCARVPTRSLDPFVDFSTMSAFTAIHPKEKYFGPMEMGLYAFTLPDKASEEFVDSYDDNYLGGTTACVDLANLDYASLILFTDIGGDSTTLAVTLDYHLEFRTSSMLFPVGFSTLRLEDYHVSQMALARMGTFFENPVHLSSIASMVMGAVRSLAPIVAPYALQAAHAVGSHILSRVTKSSPMPQRQMVLPPRKKKQPNKAKAASRKRK